MAILSGILNFSLDMTLRHTFISVVLFLIFFCGLSLGVEQSNGDSKFRDSVTGQDSCQGLEGVYNWSYSGGSFQVELRPFGSFYSKKYSALATWALVDKKVTIDWKKFGKIELEVPSACHQL
jgi:hypothetical protein